MAVLLLPPVLLLGGVEGAYRWHLPPVDARPRAPAPRMNLATRALWAAEEDGPFQLDPLWPWTLMADVLRRMGTPRHALPPAGAGLAWSVAREWRQAQPGDARARSLEGLALCIWLTRHWSAEELLTAYAEQADFGHGFTGLEAASRGYFGEPPEQLALAEAALLAGLPSSPRRFDPVCEPEQARRRRNRVLTRLRALGWISEAEHEAARAQPVPPTLLAKDGEACARTTPSP